MPFMMIWLLACAPAAPLVDSGAAAACPEGMVPVGEVGELSFCVDAYEVLVEGELGSADQLAPDAVPPEATASALPGVVPSYGVSFDQARAICAATPALDAQGELRGYKRLVSSQEWEDAGDGLLGEGGLAYPYGDAWDDSACVTLADDGSQPWAGPQPTGSLPRCTSPFGVVDLVGNLWEWADPGQVIDVARTLALGEAIGLRLDPDDALRFDGSLADDPPPLRIDVAGVQPDALTLGPDGELLIDVVYPSDWSWAESDARGFLVLDAVDVGAEAERWLPVRVSPLGEVPGPAQVWLEPDQDGAPLTDKRGCAYYAGWSGGCVLSAPYHGHVHDFDGSIGFRCVSEPL